MGLIQLLRGLLKLEIRIKQHRFSRGAELKGNAFSATMTGRKDIAFPNHGVMRQAMLIMKNAVKTSGWSYLAGMKSGVNHSGSSNPMI